MTGADEEWLNAALSDDSMVVELLLQLHGGTPRRLKPAAVPLNWRVRQPRSRTVSVNNSRKKHAQRASPTTPLSWSGATSISGGSEGAEESSRPPTGKLTNTTRSTVNGDGEKTSSKRSRKKKTLAELRDHELSLMKERRELKRKIIALRLNLEEERTANENLKRMKIELQPLADRELARVSEESTSGQLPRNTPASYDVAPRSLTSNGHPEPDPDACPKFVLPDLNIPLDEDNPCHDVVWSRLDNETCSGKSVLYGSIQARTS